ncbi:hypothetical protein [Mycobacterium sp. URHB0044]|uniref:hypothetical protein n=1 Tax=Mycobacterium sp. URHB0044 TaxID=1380386 RepID=UPI00068799F7|nr:hypothetical protein [Mycobacterium sp. URHB0044]
MTAPRRVVAVVGAPSAGVTSVAAVLADRLPDHDVVDGPGASTPDAVVVVASAVAPLVESDVELIDRAASRTDLVIAVVAKIDAHRGWRDVLAADRALLARRDERYRRVPWIGVAAAPDLGAPDVTGLVDALRAGLAQPNRGNQLQANVLRPDRRLTGRRSAGVVATRGEIQRARLALLYFVRHRCARLGADLRAEAAELARGESTQFQDRVRDAAADVVAEVDTAIGRTVAGIHGLPALPPRGDVAPPSLPSPRSTSRRLETQLMVVLGGGFGLGVALTVSRLATAVGPGSEVAGLLAGGLLGVLLTAWVVSLRGVLHDRALMDRWVGDVTAALRSGGEEMVARRLLDAEIALADGVRTPGPEMGANAPHGLKGNDAKWRNSASESFL